MGIKFKYKFWLYYSIILIIVLVIGGFYVSRGQQNLTLANWLFIPLLLFLLLEVIKFRRDGGRLDVSDSKFYFVLLIYSLLLSTIISVGGFVISRSNREIISNIVFLPVPIFCWYLFYTRPKKLKN
jgi:hypothetical protein